MSAQAWADYADVLASLAGGSLGGAAGRAIDSALTADPANAKALWLKASQAHELHRFSPDALTWWRKLLAVLPPDSPDTRIVNGNIAEDSQLAGLPARQSSRRRRCTPGRRVRSAAPYRSTLRLPPACSRVRSLFIYAKAADSPGPPLAMLRTSAGVAGPSTSSSMTRWQCCPRVACRSSTR